MKCIDKPFMYKFILAICVLIGIFSISMLLGAVNTSVRDVWLALTSSQQNSTITIIREIRLPREIAAVFVGAALGVSGAIMQGLTRNPLADPGLLGITAGANAALAITIVLIPSANYFVIMFACMIGAMMGALLVLGIGALHKGGFSPFRILLAGAAVSAFFYALAEGIGLYFKVSKNISMWTAGGLIGTTWNQLQIIVPFILLGIIVSICLSRHLTILSLSEEVAIGLGEKINHIKMILFSIMIILAGTSVALVGSLAFVGLMIPHLVRAIVGTDYRKVLPMSAILGACFMLIANTIGRTIQAPYETPIAAIVSIIGLPFFLYIVHKGGKRWI
ncbi:iron ABC transporter permease [Hazenella sp. IB182357]|uniref:Iron ABC transporter permease n=1 Tax=Polycladospora coralii TaxID=2771432 RepID=A0A926N6S7_9BACL|nr:iron ABC transporter permease [Polycladospora coralii]MBD1373534.1 iron ABC transporter permease [Polycladospora coralii]MBS7531902.1 iron ABC transporter permease [Polycladospora coralii]